MDADDLTSEVTEFDIARSTDESWSAFAARLAEVLSVMEPGASLTVGAVATETAPGPPYVTFRALAEGQLLAEAASNAQLGPFFQLGTDQDRRMAELGWSRPPTDDGASYRLDGCQEEPLPMAEGAIAVLREIYGVPHPAFLAPDQLAEILTPPPVAESGAPRILPALSAEDLVVSAPVSRDHLEQLVEAELVAILGYRPLKDSDRDYGIRVGSAMVFVRCSSDAEEILIFSPLVHELEGRSRAMEVLSDLNAESRYVRFLLLRDRVFMSWSLFARPFVPAHLRQGLRLMAMMSDAIDDDLATKLRGRTTFDEPG